LVPALVKGRETPEMEEISIMG